MIARPEETQENVFVARGAAAQLLEPLVLIGAGMQQSDLETVRWGIELAKRSPEIMIEGPAGTGKSRAACEFIHGCCTVFPGIRVLICRQTLASIRQSVQVTLEDKVWTPGRYQPIPSDAQRENIASYTYPPGLNVVDGVAYRGSSTIILGGLDKPERTFSTEYDMVWVEEGIEISLDAWEKLLRVNRNWQMPWQVALLSTNPGSEFAWPNKRAVEGGPMKRLLSRHKDNPCLWDSEKQKWTPEGKDYLETKLGHMHGAIRKRLLDGEWCSESGRVWEEYDPALHLLECELHKGGTGWYLRVEPNQALRVGLDPHVRLEWFFASQDFGFVAPGCLQVWGVDSERRAFRIIEVYRTGKKDEWWANVVRELHAKFNLRQILCDPEDPAQIELYNYHLRHPSSDARMPEEMGKIAVKASNSIKAGVKQVAWALRPDAPEGDFDEEEVERFKHPRMFLCRGAHVYGIDTVLDGEMRPTSTEQEVQSYIWPKSEDNKPIKEKPDPACADHGCDAWRYASMWLFNNDLTPPEAPARIEPGTMADIMGHKNVKRRRRR